MAQITKSLFMSGQQCVKLLWHSYRKDLPEITLSDKHKFAQGREFEVYVKKLYPGAVDLKDLRNDENIEKTKELIKQKKTIFEAGVVYKDYFLKADILQPNGNDWDLIEIKASTKVKPEHIPDLAFQKFVLEKAGLKIKRCFVIFLNKEYVKNGEINPQELASKEEVTEKVNLIKDVEENADKYLKFVELEHSPDVPIGKHCNNPYECPLKSKCWAYLPENNILQLTNWRVYWKLFEEGILDIKNIPENTKLTEKDQLIKEATDNNEVIVSKEHINQFLKSLHYPLYHLDFETFDTAVPIFDKSRPWQKIPFQYSLHIQRENNKVVHFEFLSKGSGDPRPALLENLKSQIGDSGDVMVFNKSFEINVLKMLAEDFPDHKSWIENVLSRIVDLADPFKNFYYYNPKQKGQYSIKKVLPSLTGNGYSDLEINNGGDASMQFFYSNIKHDLGDVAEIRENLLKYCCLDTEGMVWIINELKKIVYSGTK